MSAFSDVARRWHTIRHLRPRQVFYQIAHRLRRPTLLVRNEAAASWQPLQLSPPPAKRTSWRGGGRFRFLNSEANLGEPIDWQAGAMPKLWQYNLHYFEFLLQEQVDTGAGLKLIHDWIARHPPRVENGGWEPYPISLRIVNWIKFLVRTDAVPQRIVDSLGLQAANLARQLEYHIGGNHLFVNGKALWFAGAFLGNEDWSATGRRIIFDEVAEQFLPDGGHFELSPMYHALGTEDLIDLVNLCRAASDRDSSARLMPFAERALGWLQAIVGSDGNIPLLNDSARGIAHSVAALECYGNDVGVHAAASTMARLHDCGWEHRNLSGYRVLDNGTMRVVFDTAPIGPDYLPGHAHCDMLAILLEFRGREILTDTGVYEYAETALRTYSRSTGAHNTVAIDGLEQAEMWKSFRIGRRGRPDRLEVAASAISCSHNGFAQWRPGIRHVRTLKLLSNGIEVVDAVKGPQKHYYSARYHFAPGVDVAQLDGGRFAVAGGLMFEVERTAARLITTEYFPEFGLREERQTLVLEGHFDGEHEFTLRCTYSS